MPALVGNWDLLDIARDNGGLCVCGFKGIKGGPHKTDTPLCLHTQQWVSWRTWVLVAAGHVLPDCYVRRTRLSVDLTRSLWASLCFVFGPTGKVRLGRFGPKTPFAMFREPHAAPTKASGSTHLEFCFQLIKPPGKDKNMSSSDKFPVRPTRGSKQ